MSDRPPPLFGLGPDVERSLGWVAIGYRAMAVVWLVILAVGSLVGSESIPRRGVIIGAALVLVVWNAGLGLAWRRSRQVLANPIVLMVDAALAVSTFFVPFWSGNPAVVFRGGYPFSAIVLAMHARGRWAAASMGMVMLGAAFGERIVVGGDVSVGQAVTDVLGWIVPTAALIWAVEVVASSDAGRRRADAAAAEAKADRARAEERTAVAAHLHDSVLQTLALIQRDAADPDEVAALARTQERELRSWLQGTTADRDDGVRRALERVSAEIEDRYRIRVEVVTVGDVPVHDRVQAMVAAAREAIVNAAKHASIDDVRVFAEVADGTLSVFVRDRGIGFDPMAIDADRIGVRESIIGRIERHGGSVQVRSSPDRGTEVRMEMPL